ncbi:diaminopimelate epimerase [Chitinophaga skermanii]|uniref:Diaminopimelate epimerase n=1 Tax=Chitinophaga skermanii TaxID=331697 RepID=A0A327QY80_9BACT|nr:diaminopimelate epimerase [Chitinophaga skermanii]RAJ08383.1 diaminopimelate epimerase [Chitinophaga skermanii]
MQVHFHKYQGTGNDFVIIDNRNNAYDNLSQPTVAHLCDRRFGIGGDGLMLLNTSKDPQYDFEMVYYNADGNPGSMCGNGGRCLSAFAKKVGIKNDQATFIASDGPHEVVYADNGWVYLKMKDVDWVENGPGYFFLDTGSPHFVRYVTGIEEMDVFNEGRAIRYNERFAEVGTNVNFVQETENGIFVRTYERGVEDETYSCGTGVTAAAITTANGENGDYAVPVQTLGGPLEVRFKKTGERSYTDIWLCGPATWVFEGDIKI